MTVSSTTSKDTYTGNGSTVEYAYTFRILDQSHIQVDIKNSEGTVTTQTITTHYTVSDVGEAAGGNITFVTAPESTDTIIFTRAVPIKQETDYLENDSFPAEAHEEALDELTMIAQQLDEQLNRAVKGDVALSSAVDLTIPDPTGNASKYLSVNSTEDGWEYSEIGDGSAISLPVSVANGGTGSATGQLALPEGADRTIKVVENDGGVGDDLNLEAGAADAALTDKAGGDLILSGGASEGTGTSTVQVEAAKAGSSGTVTNTPQTVATFKAEGVEISPHGTSAGNTGEVRLLELAANGTNYVGFKAADSLATQIYTLPSADGAASTFLQTNGSGVLSFAVPDETDMVVNTGAAGTVLTSNGAGSAPTYQAAADPTYTFISSVTASASSEVTFTDLSSTYVAYQLILIDVVPATDNVPFSLQTSTDNGSTYDSSTGNYMWSRGGQYNSGHDNAGSTSDTRIIMFPGAGSDHTISGTIDIFNPSAAANTNMQCRLSGQNQANTPYTYSGMGIRLSAADVDAIRIFFETGNIASGTFKLYGIKAS